MAIYGTCFFVKTEKSLFITEDFFKTKSFNAFKNKQIVHCLKLKYISYFQNQ